MATSEITGKCEEPSVGCSDEAMAMQGNGQGNGNEHNDISRMNQASANNTESENTEGRNSTSVCAEVQGSGNQAVFSLKSDESLPDADADDGSEQVGPCDHLQESSESDNPGPGTDPRCDYSNDQSSASSASHSARDGKLCACRYSNHIKGECIH